VDDLTTVHAACDVFVFPSTSEGLGTSLLGAMAAGLPVVAFSTGGIGDAVQDERNGLLVQQRTPQALAEATKRVLCDAPLAQRLGQAARESVAARFTADRMVDNTLAVFERITKDAPGHA
jgi:glycosyltransferase involved in cell wall biosynthesis